MDQTTNIPDENRRSFLTTCAGALAGVTFVGVVAPLVQGCTIASAPPDGVNTNGSITVDVSSLPGDNCALMTTELGPDGRPVIVIRNSATAYTALSARCTHQDCPVDPPEADCRFHARPDATTDLIDTMYCGCHGSEFDLTGMVLVKGDPNKAQAALTKYTTSYNATTKQVTVTF